MRTKLAAASLVPLLAFLVLAGLQTGTVFARATELDDFAGQVGLARQITGLVHEMQLERDRTIGELAALGAGTSPGQSSARLTAVLQPIHHSVDASVSAFADAAGPIGGPAGWRSAVSAVTESLNQLGDLRTGILGGGLRGSAVSGGYTRIINNLLDLLAQASPGDDQPELSQPVLTYVELARAKEVNSLLRARLFAVTSAGRFAGSDVVELSDLRVQQLAALAQFRAAATEEQVERYDRALIDPVAQQAADLEQSLAGGAPDSRTALDPVKWWTLSTAEHNLIRQVEQELVDQAVAVAGGHSTRQWRQTVLAAGLILAVLLGAVVAAVLVGQSMARSLNLLRGQALRVAQAQLPQLLEQLRQLGPDDPEVEVAPPVVTSTDEIGDVAEAFHAVHRSAVHLAVEQAVMRRNVNAIFVSLARRSQVLVERQLELLDRLERDESDPDQLANLFQLDHLAARMRRNDDNLLVLAGSEARRRWARPVELSTVVMAATAEIEQYPRVRHDIDARLFIAGPVVGDLAHLLAELLENATMFSPPERSVLVTGQPGYGGRGALVEVIDSGIGMSPQALAEANRTLAEPPPVDVAAAERMGLVVVSHLAARHGIRIRLHHGTPGLTAAVTLPARLLTGAPEQTDGGDPAAAAGPPALGPARSLARLGQAPPRPALDAAAPTPLPAPEQGGGRAGRRGVPTRAEDVLGHGGQAPSTGTAWWARPEPGGTVQPRPASALPAAPPAPVTGGTNHSGLPVRVPMAQLPTGPAGGRPAVPAQRAELDPDAVAGALGRLYGGVRKAQAEDVTIPVTPPDRQVERE